MPCTGACCVNITLRHHGGTGAVLSWAEVEARQVIGARQMEEENHLERLLVRAAEQDHFNCTRFDPTTRRCTDYENRPNTCRTYPANTIQHGHLSNTCRYCGDTGTPHTGSP